jgi:hypothetical protein
MPDPAAACTPGSQTSPPAAATAAAEDAFKRADFYLKLAASAWDRQKYRRDVEWKVAIGIWTLFGAGSFGVLASNSSLSAWSILVALVVSTIIVGVYWVLWIQSRSEGACRS